LLFYSTRYTTQVGWQGDFVLVVDDRPVVFFFIYIKYLA
jgi:hypothetical protein